MPQELEQKLYEEGRAKGLRGRELDSYVYGSMRKQGWKPRRVRAPKDSGYHKVRVWK